jgi:hypothetical protein
MLTVSLDAETDNDNRGRREERVAGCLLPHGEFLSCNLI